MKVQNSSDLVQDLCAASRRKMGDFNSQDIANCSWALAMIRPDFNQADQEECNLRGAPWYEEQFVKYMNESNIIWLKVGFLRRERTFRRMQMIQKEEKEGRAYLTSDGGLLRQRVHGRPVQFFVISHPWPSRYHPDPHGFQLTRLKEVLDQQNAHDEDLVFLQKHCAFAVAAVCLTHLLAVRPPIIHIQ